MKKSLLILILSFGILTCPVKTEPMICQTSINYLVMHLNILKKIFVFLGLSKEDPEDYRLKNVK